VEVLAATQAHNPTLWDRLSGAVAPFNLPKSRECHNGENWMKGGIAVRFRMVQPIPGANEKDYGKDPPRPYLEPTQVSLGEKP
jgi:hypothetical protein